VLRLWENDQSLREHALAMIRTALSHEDAARRLQELHSTSVLTLVSEVAAEDHRELRAALIGAQLSGLLLMRYLFKVSALAAVDPTVLISAVAPTIELYLTGDLAGRVDPTAKSNWRRGKLRADGWRRCSPGQPNYCASRKPSADNWSMLIFYTLITMTGIDRMRIVFTEIGEKHLNPVATSRHLTPGSARASGT
jgi:Tetracyclin repressor-like, C-terminal domain